MSLTPCDEWTGALNEKGYGRVWRDGKVRRVHRVIWEDANGPIPSGMLVLHRCDNPPCKRLDHLFLGTAADNHRDMVSKGRQRSGMPGALHPMARLSAEDVEAIRREAAGGASRVGLAQRFGINRSHVYRIIAGTSWGAAS